MKRYEYYSFRGTHGDDINLSLDMLGEDGWEAFAIIPDGDEAVVYLKREKP